MKHFRWSPDFIDTMSWNNFMLYMASIPQTDDDEKDKPQEKHASELF